MKNNVLKKLRIKFIAMTMAMIAVVLAIIFSAICFVTYQQDVSGVFSVLNSSVSSANISENDQSGYYEYFGSDGSNDNNSDSSAGNNGTGNSTDSGSNNNGGGNSDENTSDNSNAGNNNAGGNVGNSDSSDGSNNSSSTNSKDDNSSGRIPEIGSLQGNRSRVIPVAVYKLESNSSFGFMTSMSAATVSSKTLYSNMEEIFSLPDGNGTIKSCGLYYAKNTVGNASYIAFADINTTTSWKTHAAILASIGIVALVIFFVISLFFSRWALRPVQSAWTKQRQFIADASHDLKTPITVIQANTEILLSNPEESIRSQEQWIESTQLESMHMQELVKDLLFLARMDEMPTKVVKEAVEISQIVESEALEFESIAFEQGIELSANIEPDLVVYGDKGKLHRLVRTLLDNACKYAPQDHKINLDLKREASGVQLAVHNTGSYIEPKDLEHIFDRFYRSDSSRNEHQNSHGLGLAIAKAITEEQGGNIKATSSQKDGTCFTVNFA